MNRWSRKFVNSIVGLSFLVLTISEILLICDILSEFYGFEILFFSEYHLELESLAVFALGIFLVIVGSLYLRLRSENRKYRSTIKIASGGFLAEISKKFQKWNFSESEQEVALLLIKGLTIQEISTVRMTRPGTIKSQSHAIYNKANVAGRNELSAYIIDDLLGECDFTLLNSRRNFV